MNQSRDITFELIPPSESAARLAMKWRNDPLTLANSFNSEPKIWPNFFDEFKASYVLDPSLPSFFVLEDGIKVGLLRFRRIEDPEGLGRRTCDSSLNVNPDFRGRGIHQEVMERMMPILRGLGFEAVVGEIKLNNLPAKKSVERVGFKYVGEQVRTNESGIEVLVLCYVFDLIKSFSIPAIERRVGPGSKTFVIAEAGSNWRVGAYKRDLKMARLLIDLAVDAGADAVKFQTYTAEKTYVPNAGETEHLTRAGIDETITEVFSDLAMKSEMVPELAAYCRKQGILFMSSVFSLQDLEVVDPHVAVHKIASYEISHIRLLESIARTNKPIILSTGASEMADVRWAVEYLQSRSNAGLSLLQCTARYPAPLEALNLGVMCQLRATFGLPVGLSDHSRDPLVGPIAAAALGANVIEKHFTVDNRLPGPDHNFAVTGTELKSMIAAIRAAEVVFGTGEKKILPIERDLYDFGRRGVQAIAKIEAGEVFVEGVNIDILRSGNQPLGMHPKNIECVTGKKSARQIKLGEGVYEADARDVLV